MFYHHGLVGGGAVSCRAALDLLRDCGQQDGAASLVMQELPSLRSMLGHDRRSAFEHTRTNVLLLTCTCTLYRLDMGATAVWAVDVLARGEYQHRKREPYCFLSTQCELRSVHHICLLGGTSAYESSVLA